MFMYITKDREVRAWKPTSELRQRKIDAEREDDPSFSTFIYHIYLSLSIFIHKNVFKISVFVFTLMCTPILMCTLAHTRVYAHTNNNTHVYAYAYAHAHRSRYTCLCM